MIVLEKQGAVIAAYKPDHRSPGPSKTAKRGVVSEFSRKSRRNMLLLLNRCSYDCRVTFLTLTFHYSPTVSQSNAAFKRFVKCLRRMFPDVSAIWRREVQPIRGAIHFHLLLFRLAYWPQAQIQALWTRCTQEDRSIVHVRLLDGRKAVIGYVSKYIAKVEKPLITTSLDLSPYQAAPEKRSIGRCWGYINKRGLPLAETTVLVIADEDIEQQIWLAAAAMTGGRCGNDAAMLIVFTGHADDWVQAIRRKAKIALNERSDLARICRPTHEKPTEPIFENLWQSA